MLFYLLSRLTMLAFGLLYPVFCSYKAIKEKNARAYNRWLIHWIVLALFITVEMVVEPLFFWFPFYYELKICLILCLASPRGPQFLYRRFIHPAIAEHEPMIDGFIDDVNNRVTDSLRRWGSGLITSATQNIWQAALRVGPPSGVASLGQMQVDYSNRNRMITQGDAVDSLTGFGAQNYAYSYERATLDAIMRSGNEDGMSSEEDLPREPAYLSSPPQAPMDIETETPGTRPSTRSKSKGRGKKRSGAQGPARRGRRNSNVRAVEVTAVEAREEEFRNAQTIEIEVQIEQEQIEPDYEPEPSDTPPRTTRRRRRAV